MGNLAKGIKEPLPPFKLASLQAGKLTGHKGRREN
jgi:hypothetical protein